MCDVYLRHEKKCDFQTFVYFGKRREAELNFKFRVVETQMGLNVYPNSASQAIALEEWSGEGNVI